MMNKYYLLRDENTYSDSGDYLQKPENRDDGVWVEGLPEGLTAYIEKNMNEKLEAEFLKLLPKHMEKAYLTNNVIYLIIQAKVSIINANQIDSSGFLGKSILESLVLPAEMDTDRQI